MSGNDQIIVVNPEIAHRSVRQIELQRLPVVSVIKRNPNRIFSPGEEQAFANGIFAHRVDGAEVRQAGCNQLPVLAAVVCAIDIGAKIVDAEPTHRSVRSALVEVRRGDLRDLAPRSQFFRRDIGPILPGVVCNPQ